MPHNKKTVRAIELNEGIVSCICWKTFAYESIKDLRLKIYLYELLFLNVIRRQLCIFRN